MARMEFHIVTDSVMRGCHEAERLMGFGWKVSGVIGTMEALMGLPDGTRLLLYRVNGSAYPPGDVVAAAEGMIARGVFTEIRFDG